MNMNIPEMLRMSIKIDKKEKIKEPDTNLAERRVNKPLTWFTDFDDMFNEFRRNMLDSFWPESDEMTLPSIHPSREGTRIPPMDIISTDTEYKVHAEMPDLDKDDIKIELDNNQLSITAEKKTEEEQKKTNYLHRERTYQRYFRSLVLPEDALTGEDIGAKLENGLLEITVKRKAKEPKKQVQIK